MTLKLTLFGCLTLNTLLMCRADLGFGYPEAQEEGLHKQNSNKKKPVYIPNHCRQDELLYPGDQSDDWVCDCKPGYIYYPLSNLCYAAYRKGPCRPNQYLILPKTSAIPECILNPCQVDGLVPFKNKCYSLQTPGPCSLPELSYVVGVNATTLHIECISDSVQFSLADRFGSEEATSTTTTTTTTAKPLVIPVGFSIDEIGGKECFIGSKRKFENKCPEETKVQTKN